MTETFQSFLSLCMYVALGLALYLWQVGPVIWSSAMVYVYMALWPFFVLFFILKWVLIIGAGIIVGVMIYSAMVR